MLKCKNAQIKNAYKRYLEGSDYTLSDVYDHYSTAKQDAFEYCQALCRRYCGRGLKVIGFNTMAFSCGFIAFIDGEECFIWITSHYDRYMPLNEF